MENSEEGHEAEVRWEGQTVRVSVTEQVQKAFGEFHFMNTSLYIQMTCTQTEKRTRSWGHTHI